MRSEIKTFSYPNGDIQRVQLVHLEDWQQLDFLHPRPSDTALDSFERIYRKFLVPSCPWLFGNLVLFRLPEDLSVALPMETKKYGRVADVLTAAAAVLEQGVRFLRGKPFFRNPQAETLYRALEQRNCLYLVQGKLPTTTAIPVRNISGYLTETEEAAAMKVNASFFIMDRFDCATVYDHVGTPFGLCVKNGIIENPPLFRREALLVKQDGSVTVEAVDIQGLEIEINGMTFAHGKNAVIHSRPHRAKTPDTEKNQLVIIGRKVAAVRNGSVPIPSSGFVLCTNEDVSVQPGDQVTYHGMEDIRFGIQVGNSILRNGEKTETFRSQFYNIRRLEPVPFPPSLYPMDFKCGRAARIALGADIQGKPMLLWAEGAAKLGHVPGQDSCGASLSEMAEICSALGMINAVNLDGGGSAQILLQNRRSLQISDRKETDHTEAERPVPLGLIIR